MVKPRLGGVLLGLYSVHFLVVGILHIILASLIANLLTLWPAALMSLILGSLRSLVDVFSNRIREDMFVGEILKLQLECLQEWFDNNITLPDALLALSDVLLKLLNTRIQCCNSSINLAQLISKVCVRTDGKLEIVGICRNLTIYDSRSLELGGEVIALASKI